MPDTAPLAGTMPPPQRPGERLREARLARGMDLAELAARTRIPTRHLEAIEEGDYSRLPSQTYATGFTKACARVLGLDEADIARDVRAELAQRWDREPTVQAYDVSEPPRAPTSGVVWGGAAVAVLLLVVLGLWFGTDLLRGSSDAAPATAPQTAVSVPVPASTPAPVDGGQVSLTANDEVWVRIYDAADTTLFMKTMQPGERYDVPPGANRPMINVGRPDKLAITVNGSNVPPLGDGKVAIKDVPISAAALTSRRNGAPRSDDAGSTP